MGPKKKHQGGFQHGNKCFKSEMEADSTNNDK